jgi:hypothetical protein
MRRIAGDGCSTSVPGRLFGDEAVVAEALWCDSLERRSVDR